MQKHLLYIVSLMACMLFAATQQTTAQTVASAADSAKITLGVDELADAIIAEAKRYIGYPYKYGTMGPNTFDCTGFSGFIFRKFGYKLTRSSKSQATDGRPVAKGYENLQKGDILIFGSRKNPSVVGHVGIFIALEPGGKDFTFIHASNSGVRISHLTETYYIKRYLYARRILPDFLDLTVSFDSTATYPFADSARVELPALQPDSTMQQANKKGNQLLLFSGGKWASVDSLGNVRMPSEDKRILLLQDGTWIHLTEQTATTDEPSIIQTEKPQPQSSKDFCENAGPLTPEEAAATTQQSSSASTDEVTVATTQQPTTCETPAEQPSAGTTQETAHTTQQSTTAGTDEVVVATTEKVYHKVVSGDTLYSLAKRYETTVSDICKLNNIDESKPIIKVGQSLRIK